MKGYIVALLQHMLPVLTVLFLSLFVFCMPVLPYLLGCWWRFKCIDRHTGELFMHAGLILKNIFFFPFSTIRLFSCGIYFSL